MKFSRDWLNDSVDLGGISDEKLGGVLTDIGHAIEAVEKHGDDTIFDLEVTTNRVDAMSHRGMARELAAALGRKLSGGQAILPVPDRRDRLSSTVTIRIDAPEMCHRYTGLAIRGVTMKPSPIHVARRLEAVGLRPINNVVDATNYVMLALGHPLHAFDLDKHADATIVVRAGKSGETIKTLDGETRKIDPQTVVIADAKRAVALGGIIGGFESEITSETRNVLLECAWFDPSTVRRTARRLGINTDASYRFERRVDPNDTVEAAVAAAELIGGSAEAPIDVVALEDKPETLPLRSTRLQEASGGIISDGYALELFRRLGFGAEKSHDGLAITVPTYRGDIHEEMDLIEEVLRFFGLNKIPASLPKMTMGDVRRENVDIAEDRLRDVFVGCGLTEATTYSFIRREWNALFSDEEPVMIANALSENVASMRLSLLPGLLETVAFNRSYGTRDGALFEVGRAYYRRNGGVEEHRRAAFVMFGAGDFFDAKGVLEQLAQRFHVELKFAVSDQPWLKKGNRAIAWNGDRAIASIGALSSEALHTFDIKGEVHVAEMNIPALLESQKEWKMAPVARFPGVPMILAVTHGHDLQYQRLLDTIRGFEVPYLHDVGLRDRFVPEGGDVVKTTLGMWYQAFDRSLTQEEVAALQQQLAARLTSALPVKLVS